jgi:hypothetical protein
MHGAAGGWRILFAVVGWAGVIVAALDHGLEALGRGDSTLTPS